MNPAHQRRALAPTAPIGIFDSGVGGLTVTREIMRVLPHERLIYIGDTARCPYGPKDPIQIETYALEIGQYLVDQGVKLIVIACNTATAHALATLQSNLAVACIGVIEPGARAAALATLSGRVGVIGTQGTIKSGLYTKHLLQLDRGLQIVSQATPAFVDIVEKSFSLDACQARAQVSQDFAQVAPAYLAPILAHNADVLVMGCTHFPLLAPLLASACGPQVRLISSAQQTADQVRSLLCAKGLLAQSQASVDTGKVPQVSDTGSFGFSRDVHEPEEEMTSVVQDLAVSEQRNDGHPQVTCFTTAPDTTAFERAAQRILGETSYRVTHLPLSTLVHSACTVTNKER